VDAANQFVDSVQPWALAKAMKAATKRLEPNCGPPWAISSKPAG